MSTRDDLITVALTEFAVAGYTGTSLQRIAELAGVSKSSVLYHFESKEALLEAAIGPAVEKMRGILDGVEGTLLDPQNQIQFIEQFVDILLEQRLAVHMFINQGAALEDVPVVERANQLVLHLADFFNATVSSTEDQLRFGIALGGAAYVLASKPLYGIELPPVNEIRAALVTIVTELLAPLTLPTAHPILEN